MQQQNQPESQATFQTFGFRPTTLAALAKKGYKTPTPIQTLAIPIVMQGEDLIAQAQTGTGKTAAFGLPLVEDTRPRVLQTLILAPTRELANQIVEELTWMGANTPFKAYPVYGGVGFGNQINALRRGDITCLVACPGRLLDLLQRGDVRLDHVRHVILDEADRMLDMGFIRDIEKIFKFLPRERQTMLFSATMPPEVRKLAERYLNRPEFVRAESGPTATELTDQFEIRVQGDKFPVLLALMKKEDPVASVIFTKTKHGAKRLARRLAAVGYNTDALQGNLSQNARDRVMAAFRDGKLDHLVATDVAARGLDVSGISHVINYDFPMVNEDYVHRIGRTGRAGKRGRAFLFVDREEERDARAVERISGVRLEPYDVGPLPVVPPEASAGAMKPQLGYSRGQPQQRQGGGQGQPRHHKPAGQRHAPRSGARSPHPNRRRY
ncbi:MAG: ATP-dependent helicase RhlE [Thermoplasmata archaeon]|jgi:ATP-dependent RNA helicase DeaD|nr:ATP-dependent helicase RhlE [Thermoplasmata archaeon]